MTKEEFEALWERVKANDEQIATEFEEKFRKLPKEEQERILRENENCRYWEDLSDADRY